MIFRQLAPFDWEEEMRIVVVVLLMLVVLCTCAMAQEEGIFDGQRASYAPTAKGFMAPAPVTDVTLSFGESWEKIKLTRTDGDMSYVLSAKQSDASKFYRASLKQKSGLWAFGAILDSQRVPGDNESSLAASVDYAASARLALGTVIPVVGNSDIVFSPGYTYGNYNASADFTNGEKPTYNLSSTQLGEIKLAFSRNCETRETTASAASIGRRYNPIITYVNRPASQGGHTLAIGLNFHFGK